MQAKFQQKRQQFYTTVLPAEIILVQKQVAQIYHNYHLRHLNGDLKYGDPDQTHISIQNAKKNISNVITRAHYEIQKLLDLSKIKFDWLKNAQSFNTFDFLKTQLINCFFKRHTIIIFDHLRYSLNYQEQKEFQQILQNLRALG